MESLYLTAAEVAYHLGVSKPKAYQIIKQLNDELKKNGFIVIPGRVSRAYFKEKWYGGING